MKTQRILIQCLVIIFMTIGIQSCSESDEIPEVVSEENLDITSEKNGFTINIINQDAELSQDILNNLIDIFHEAYPKMVAKYNDNAPKKVKIVIVENSIAGIAISNGVVKMGANWIEQNSKNIDVLVHELMHIVQAYTQETLYWLKEGIADFVRDEFGTSNSAAGWSLTAYSDGQSHSDSSQITASFLKWIESNHDDSFVKHMDEELRDNGYSSGIWEEFTGYSLENLWILYSGGTVEEEVIDDDISSEKDGYTINIIDQKLLGSNVITVLINTFHYAYPKMAAKYRPNSSHVVKVTIDANYDGVAYAGGDGIVISAAWLINNPGDTDLLVHELMHLVQSYAGGSPGWLTEGIADLVRDEFGYNNVGWGLATYSDGQSYEDAYTVTGGFLKWIEANHDDSFVQKINETLHDGSYRASLWKEYTGYSVDDLWTLYSGGDLADSDVDWTESASIKVSKENPDGANGGEGSSKLIDNNENTKFLIFEYPSDFWIQQELPQSQIVNKYTFTSGNDVPGRDPKSWELSGSNDESTWVELDTRTDESFDARNQTKEYTFTSTIAYKYYRLSITENAGAAIFQLSEWRLLETKQ